MKAKFIDGPIDGQYLDIPGWGRFRDHWPKTYEVKAPSLDDLIAVRNGVTDDDTPARFRIGVYRLDPTPVGPNGDWRIYRWDGWQPDPSAAPPPPSASDPH